ncbi:PEP-CTERM sorting domain-containing protein [Cellvibrio mixtus]|uniref:PEP-CTERM sorting domain-containing protein n=1 Tax=Cellvibrio mixtus TaxID=39650 RepID=UPI000587A104|nr:PEP-CTERM sorting domain-containing protein [Cellvibrio mixtus]
MLKQFKSLILGVGALMGVNAHAVIISGDQVTSGGKQVALQGLEWLSLDHTVGFSRADIEDGFTDRFGNTWNAGDWRYATRAETTTLLSSLWGGVWTGELGGWQSSNHDGASWFINAFEGLAYDSGFGNGRIDKTYTFPGGYKNHDFSQFFFGNQYECNGRYDFTCYGLVQVADYHSSSNNSEKTGWLHKGYGLSMQASNIATLSISSGVSRGSLLVRTAREPVNVPESSGLILLGLGLLGMMTRRRFKS